MIRKMSLTLMFALLLIPAVARAQAAPDRISYGEANALLHTFGGGASAVYSNPAEQPVLLNTFPTEAAIVPFFSEGNHYCVLDYHAIMILWASGGDSSFTRQDAEGLNTISNTFVLNGVTMETERTTIRRHLATEFFGVEKAFSFVEGTVLAPDALDVGEHTLYFQATAGGVVLFESNTTFYIDAADSSTCQ